MIYGVHNFIEIRQQIKLRVAPVALVLSSQSNSTCRMSRASSRAVRQARHRQNAWARHVERLESCRDVTSQVE